MNTTITILRPGLPPEIREVHLPAQPPYTALKAIIDPLLNGAFLEHVTFLTEDGQRGDMFVDEHFQLKGLSRNDKATEHYRRATLRREPGTDPESLPAICGTAIVFSRRVWF